MTTFHVKLNIWGEERYYKRYSFVYMKRKEKASTIKTKTKTNKR